MPCPCHHPARLEHGARPARSRPCSGLDGRRARGSLRRGAADFAEALPPIHGPRAGRVPARSAARSGAAGAPPGAAQCKRHRDRDALRLQPSRAFRDVVPPTLQRKSVGDPAEMSKRLFSECAVLRDPAGGGRTACDRGAPVRLGWARGGLCRRHARGDRRSAFAAPLETRSGLPFCASSLDCGPELKGRRDRATTGPSEASLTLPARSRMSRRTRVGPSA